MSSSNVTPAVRSSLKNYKEKYQKLKENYTAKVTENKSLKEELLKYQVEVRTLRRMNGTKLIFATSTSSNHSAKINCY